MTPHSAIAISVFLFVSVTTFAADAGTAQETTRRTLLYGIDSQVLDAISTLSAAQDASYTPELTRTLGESKSYEVRKAILDLFKTQNLKDGEGSARSILTAWQDGNPALVVSSIQYLAAIKASGLPPVLAPLVDATDNSEAAAALQALGTSGDASSVTLLVDKIKSLDYPDARRADVILALGLLKSPAAVDALVTIAKNTDEDKVRRMYAADSLGKIGDARALPVLRDMFAEPDALIRLYATSAIARFSLDEAFPNLIQGLRDENVKVREQSAQGLGQSLSAAQAATAVPILSFKAESDPEKTVRLAAIKSLGVIGGDSAMALLLKIYSGASNSIESREAALTVLSAKSLSTSIGEIRRVVTDEWKSYDTNTLESTAKILSTVIAPELKDLFVTFLDSSDPVVRSYGVRGIAANGLRDLKDRVKKISEQDPNPGTRAEASKALAKL